jgi:hypothetical protein
VPSRCESCSATENRFSAFSSYSLHGPWFACTHLT